MKFKQKKGIMLSHAFGAVLFLIMIAMLVILSVYLISSIGTSVTPTGQACTSSAACNASTATNAQFATYPTLVGLVGTVIFLGIVIGVLVSSFAFGQPEA